MKQHYPTEADLNIRKMTKYTYCYYKVMVEMLMLFGTQLFDRYTLNTMNTIPKGTLIEPLFRNNCQICNKKSFLTQLRHLICIQICLVSEHHATYHSCKHRTL